MKRWAHGVIVLWGWGTVLAAVNACTAEAANEEAAASGAQAINRGKTISDKHMIELKGCSGYLLCETVVLTAGHCEPKVGDIAMPGNDENAAVIDKVETLSTNNGPDDLALAHLAKGLPFDGKTAFTLATGDPPKEGTAMEIYGFGGAVVDGGYDSFGTLRKGSVTFWGMFAGMVKFKFKETDAQACKGDSGGPAVAGGKIYGVASFSFSDDKSSALALCATTTSAEYAPVFTEANAAWIKKLTDKWCVADRVDGGTKDAGGGGSSSGGSSSGGSSSGGSSSGGPTPFPTDAKRLSAIDGPGLGVSVRGVSVR